MKKSSPNSETPNPKGERIAKVMARAGLCSRRDAERWIADARVKVNGKVITTPATLITDKDRVQVDGKDIAEPEKTRLWRFHKREGYVTTHKDEMDRRTVFDALPENLPRVISVGRLDLNTEGLLLLTNDGELARHLEHPSKGWTRRYRVRAFGHVDMQKLESLKKGITVDGINYGPIDAVLEKEQGANNWLVLSLTEGKNREVKKVLDAIGLKVNRLIRVSYGPFQLGHLAKGAVEEVNGKILKEQIADYFKTKE